MSRKANHPGTLFGLPTAIAALGLALSGTVLSSSAPGQPPVAPSGFEQRNESTVSTTDTRSTSYYAISKDQLKRHVVVLASDTFEGREAGSRGGHAAAAYIVNQLRTSLVEPVSGRGFLQEFGNGYRNILGLIPGTDAELSDEIILIGAHFDHVGYGSKENSNGQIGQIHNGADDNASGVAAMIELARHFRQRPVARPLLFAFWDAEEKGLLGSQYWVSVPTVDRKHVRFAFNTDMIGRLREDDLEVLGTRTAPGLRNVVSTANTTTNLHLDFNWDIVRDSDHFPFVERAIPFLMLCTKKHPEYHRPDDDIQTLNYDGMEKITEILLRSIRKLGEQKELPSYRSTARFETQSTKKTLERVVRRQPSRMGITYSEISPGGPIRIRTVAADSAAQRGGLKAGDIVLEFAGQTLVKQPFSALVQTARNPVAIVFQRPGEKSARQTSIQLGGNPIRFGLQVRDDEAEPGQMVVVRTTLGLPAAQAGLKPRDRVLAIDRQPFASGDEFWKLISAVNQSTQLTIERAGRMSDVVMSVK